jgi:hypothetical protein
MLFLRKWKTHFASAAQTSPPQPSNARPAQTQGGPRARWRFCQNNPTLKLNSPAILGTVLRVLNLSRRPLCSTSFATGRSLDASPHYDAAPTGTKPPRWPPETHLRLSRGPILTRLTTRDDGRWYGDPRRTSATSPRQRPNYRAEYCPRRWSTRGKPTLSWPCATRGCGGTTMSLALGVR